jgi:hypothetical protein
MKPLSRAELRDEIVKLNRIDPRRDVYSTICSIYAKITSGFTTFVGSTGGAELFYRVRKTKGLKPIVVSELQAPPAEFVTGYQRCNPPSVSMFYAASKRVGALVEARVEVGDIVYLSQWIGRDRMPVNLIFDATANQVVPGVDNSTMQGPNNEIVQTYLDTQFTRRIHATFADDYKFTAAIAQQLTTNYPPNEKHHVRNDRFVALKYPSVLGIEIWHNTVMHASFALERLDLLHVMELRIIGVVENDIAVEVLDTAISFLDGGIHWSGSSDMLPRILGKDRGVPFISDGTKWNIMLHGEPITPEFIRALMLD